ncbi:hypothetical protein B5G10_09620 [Barnesiella sp. An55]|nr:hypothetical protein B5G10_09620 [Barnesiella sp. An55]
MPNRLLSSGKIAKGESRDKRKTKFSTFDYAEPPPFFWKDSERREQRQTENEGLFPLPRRETRFRLASGIPLLAFVICKR